MTHRLFIALEIPEEAIDKVCKIRDEVYGIPNDVRWESKDKLHITLKFLGDVGENMTELIINQLDAIVCDKFNAEFSFFGIFKKNKLPKILWVGIKENKRLMELQNKVENAIELLGFEKEKRKFKPHITLLRIKGKEDFDKIRNFQKYSLPIINFNIERILLLKSILQPNGSEYSVIKSFNLI